MVSAGSRIGALFLLGLLSSVLALLAPFPLKLVVDSVIGSRPLPPELDRLLPDAIDRSAVTLALFGVGLLVLIALLGRLIGPVNAMLCSRTREGPVPRIITESIIPLLVSTATLAGMIYVTARIDGPLALVTIAVSLGLLVTSWIPRGRLHREAREDGRFARSAHPKARSRLTGTNGVSSLVGLTTAIGTGAMLLFGIPDVRSGALTLGALLVALSYVHQVRRPAKTLGRKAPRLGRELARARRALNKFDASPAERPAPLTLSRATGAVAFHNVSFARGRNGPLLSEISFAVEPGARLGILGASSADKRAIIGLLTRRHDPARGEVSLDGVDLRHYRLEDLRRQFAIVPRNPALLPDSIAGNIACARRGAGMDEVISAAQAANAHDFILRLPQGYDTQVGRRGVQLSDGQLQRIAFARAFLLDCPVLVLDEPVTAFDAEEEAAFRRAIRRLVRGRTAIMMTHRATLLETCTAHIALEGGRVVADTTRSASRPQPAAAQAAESAPRPNLQCHPAVRAWRQLRPGAEPLRIEPLRVRRRKNMVYRLEDAGPGGTSVIAKRCPRAVALVERTVYEDILPRLTVPSLRHYGYCEEPDGEYSWVFMEEATGVDYSNLLADHRTHAARWLGMVHRDAALPASNGALPEAGPGRYLELVRSIHELMQQHGDNPMLSQDDIDFIQATRARLDDLVTNWHRLEEICSGAPRTLVHGDFNGKNFRVRSTNGTASIVVFDWEHAGWGVPAVDLAQLTVQSRRLAANPDLATYTSIVRERWPELSPEAWQRLAYCGTVFRTLSALSWDAESLAYDWAHTYVSSMRVYAEELESALERLGWTRRAPSREAVET